MNKTVVINFKTRPDIKRQAQKLAEEFGISLSSLINLSLVRAIKEKAVSFGISEKEEPSDWLIQALKESDEDIKAGRVISFESPDDALSYVDNLINTHGKNKKS